MMANPAAGGIVMEQAGSGVPVVMIHGLGGTSNTFQPLMAGLSNHWVLRPDLPGSGRSPLSAAPPSIESFARAVLDAIKSVGVGRAHFVGHSMGTLVCQHLAVHAPESVASLCLFGALTEPPDAARSGLAGRAGTARQGKMDEIADQIIAGTLSPQTHEDRPAAAAFVRESIMRQDPEGYAQACEALAKATAFNGDRIKAPTLLIAGDTDPVAPVSMGTLLAERIPRAAISVLERCGHWIPIEKPKESAGKLAEFLMSNAY